MPSVNLGLLVMRMACWSTIKSKCGKDTDSEQSLIFLLSHSRSEAGAKTQFFSLAHPVGSDETRTVKIASV